MKGIATSPATGRRLAPVLVVALLATCGDGPEGGRRDGGAGEPEQGAAPRVPALAITIDDLPWVGPLSPGADRQQATERILAALEAHGAPATGFVNCGRVEDGAPVLEAWLAAGHALGNHTAEHLDLNHADPARWAADAASCDSYLRELTGKAPLYFRYPYLHRGPTEERYRAGRRAVGALGSVVAPVTINTADWILDDAYVAALRKGEVERARAIADAYVEHVLRATRHYREVARERTGRDVIHVLLLHANALLADRLDGLLERLAEEGFRFVPLAEALEDPVYALEDDYLGPEGLSWLYRMAPATPGAQAWDEAEAAALRRTVE